MSTSLLLFSGHLRCARCWRLRRGCPDICIIPLQRKINLFVAQREGRAKDSNDRTQDSVLKMLAMGGEGDLIDRLKEMNIAPLAISYEYDPCDFLKAREFQLKRDIEGIKKQHKTT